MLFFQIFFPSVKVTLKDTLWPLFHSAVGLSQGQSMKPRSGQLWAQYSLLNKTRPLDPRWKVAKHCIMILACCFLWLDILWCIFFFVKVILGYVGSLSPIWARGGLMSKGKKEKEMPLAMVWLCPPSSQVICRNSQYNQIVYRTLGGHYG